MDNNLRHNKTDKVDAYRLALIQFNAPQKLRAPQPKEYHELQNASRYYEELTQALIINKNQLHRNLQSTFPQIESILSTSSGRVYWTIVSLFPHAQYVLNHNENQVFQSLLAILGIGRQRAYYLTTRLYALARQVCVAFDSSILVGLYHFQKRFFLLKISYSNITFLCFRCTFNTIISFTILEFIGTAIRCNFSTLA